jgi:hypothetical protein
VKYNKPTMWNGKDLEGGWEITTKVDGIRAFKKKKKVVSRNDKPLYNLDHLEFNDAEIWLGSFKKTVVACRTKNKTQIIPQAAVFNLDPLDKRLHREVFVNPNAAAIWREFKEAKAQGFEGLVLRNKTTGVWLKVKKEETIDVKIIGFYEGKGKHAGKLGGFITTHGRVGTGLKDSERRFWTPVLSLQPKTRKAWDDHALPHIGMTIECKCMELTEAGKMRKPRFIRLRPDK